MRLALAKTKRNGGKQKRDKDIELYREEFERRERKLKIGCPLLLEALRFGSENSDICQFSQHSFHLVK